MMGRILLFLSALILDSISLVVYFIALVFALMPFDGSPEMVWLNPLSKIILILPIIVAIIGAAIYFVKRMEQGIFLMFFPTYGSILLWMIFSVVVKLVH